MDKDENEYKKYKNNTLSETEKDYLNTIEKLGLIPAWVEMTVKPADVVDEMNS